MKPAKSHSLLIYCFQFFLLLSFILSACTAQTNKEFDLKYNFRNGETLQYRIQQFDSTRYDIQGRTDFGTIFRHKLQILTITNHPGQNSFSAVVKLDSSTIENSLIDDQNSELRFYLDYDPEVPEKYFLIDEKGNPLDKNMYYVPTLIPLPDHPVSLNQTWQFTIQHPVQETEYFKGNTIGKGHCLFFDVQKTPSDTTSIFIVKIESETGCLFLDAQKTASDSIAIFIAEIESETEGKIKLIRPNNTIEYNYLKNQSSTNYIYFDTMNGLILKVVASVKSETVLKNKNRYSKQTSTSKLFINLVETRQTF